MFGYRGKSIVTKVSALLLAAGFLTWTADLWAGDVYWQLTGQGDWSDAAAWSTASVPTSADTVYLSNSGTIGVSTSAGCGLLYIDSGTLSIAGTGNFAANNQYVGNNGTGSFLQSSGTNTLNECLYIGYNAGSSGSYQLDGDGYLKIGTTYDTRYEEYIGYSGTGSFTQTGGTNRVTSNLFLGFNAGSSGTYTMTGGLISTDVENVGHRGSGLFIQTSGTNNAGMFFVGLVGGGSGTYLMQGGKLRSSAEEIHNGTFVHTGGLNSCSSVIIAAGNSYMLSGSGALGSNEIMLNGLLNLSENGYINSYNQIVSGDFRQYGGTNKSWAMYLGCAGSYMCYSGTNGSYRLQGGELTVGREDFREGYLVVGESLVGTFIQTGGSHTDIGQGVLIGNHAGSRGTYQNSGGSHTVNCGLFLGYEALSSGTYELSGTGRLTAQSEFIGYAGQGSFIQTGGAHTVGDLNICDQGLYQFTGGTLDVTSSLTLAGTLDFMGSSVTLSARDAVVDIRGGTLVNSSSATLDIGPNSMLITRASLDPSSIFGAYSNAGLAYVPGTPLLVPAGRSFTRNMTIDDFVDCRGTMTAKPFGSLQLNGGLRISGSGYVDTVKAPIAFDGSDSAISDEACLISNEEYVGYAGNGLLRQSGGFNTCKTLAYIGNQAGSSGTYELSGGQLVVGYELDMGDLADEYLGYSGTGRFVQTGGSHVVQRYLYMGYNAGSTGSYTLSGGTLTAGTLYGTEYIGYSGSGSFVQSGGTHTVNAIVHLAQNPGSRGSYQLDGGQLVVTALCVGEGGTGRFTQTGGSYSCGGINVGQTIGSEGLYELIGPAQVSATAELIGVSGQGTFIQTSGTNNISQVLYIGYDGNSVGTYRLEGGWLSAPSEYLGNRGAANGSMIHTGGDNSVSQGLYLGTNLGATGTYDLSGTGKLTAGAEVIGNYGRGAFLQSGGVNTIAGDFYVGLYGGSVGNYELSQGDLSAKNEYIGNSGTGSFVQTGGSHRVAASLYLGKTPGSAGTFRLSGSSSLSTGTEYIGYVSAGTIVQEGGIHTVGTAMYVGYLSNSTGSYQLSGDGQLGALAEYVGYSGTGTFLQTGGTNSVAYLSVGAKGLYQLGAAALDISSGLALAGTMDFMSATGALRATNAIIDFSGGTVKNASNASVTVYGAYSLLVASADPQTTFGSYSSEGVTYVVGTPMVVPPGRGFTRSMSVNDFVDCRGAIAAPIGGALNLSSGVMVSGTGSVDLGSGALTVSGSNSGLKDDGRLTSQTQYIGYNGSGEFAQSGGTSNCGSLFVGYNVGSVGRYELSGSGSLTAASAYVGYSGTGSFSQSGGSHSVGGAMYIGYGPGSSGTYELVSGSLTASSEYVGYSGAGAMLQSGGTNTAGLLSIGALGLYRLSGGELGVTGLLVLKGTLDFAGSESALVASNAIFDLSAGSVCNSSAASLSIGPNCLLMTATGFDPATAFAHYTNDGVSYVPGSTLSVPAGRGFTWSATINDFVDCRGTISSGTGGAMNLPAGAVVSGQGIADLGLGSVTADGTGSGISGAGCLSAQTEYVGYGKAGEFLQTGGTNNCRGHTYVGFASGSRGTYDNTDGVHLVGTALYVGYNSGSSGTYRLSGAGQVSDTSAYIGFSGSGTFTQNGGVHTCRGSMYVGYNSGSTGSYQQLSGSTTVGNTLILGYNSGSTGSYQLESGQLSARFEFLGRSGTGRFYHSGGSNLVTSMLYIGYNSGCAGIYELSGEGQLSASSETIGNSGTGSVIQSGGINSVTGNVYLGYYANSSGSYRMSGGQLSAGSETIGRSGTGTFIQSGGSNSAGSLFLGSYSGGSGTYQLSGTAQLSAARAYIASSSEGSLTISDPAVQVAITGLLSFGSRASFSAVSGSSLHMSGTSLKNYSTVPANLAGLANLNLIVEGGLANVLQYEVAGKDVGLSPDGWLNNFALGTLTLGGTDRARVTLVNSSSNNTGWSGSEALYVSQLVMLPGSAVDTNGLHLYYLNGGAPKMLGPGDANLDGEVDIADYTAWFNHYGMGTSLADGDMNGDMEVDIADYTLWFNNYGPIGHSSVPEPATLAMLVLGALAVMRRRK